MLQLPLSRAPEPVVKYSQILYMMCYSLSILKSAMMGVFISQESSRPVNENWVLIYSFFFESWFMNIHHIMMEHSTMDFYYQGPFLQRTLQKCINGEVLPLSHLSALLTQEERQWHKNIMFEEKKILSCFFCAFEKHKAKELLKGDGLLVHNNFFAS